MKLQSSSSFFRSASGFFFAVICLLPALLSAHPGHDHPDETDEFDFLTAMFFHSHGALDYLVAAIAVVSLALVCFHGKASVRIAALAAAAGSIALLPIL